MHNNLVNVQEPSFTVQLPSFIVQQNFLVQFFLQLCAESGAWTNVGDKRKASMFLQECPTKQLKAGPWALMVEVITGEPWGMLGKIVLLSKYREGRQEAFTRFWYIQLYKSEQQWLHQQPLAATTTLSCNNPWMQKQPLAATAQPVKLSTRALASICCKGQFEGICYTCAPDNQGVWQRSLAVVRCVRLKGTETAGYCKYDTTHSLLWTKSF